MCWEREVERGRASKYNRLRDYDIMYNINCILYTLYINMQCITRSKTTVRDTVIQNSSFFFLLFYFHSFDYLNRYDLPSLNGLHAPWTHCFTQIQQTTFLFDFISLSLSLFSLLNGQISFTCSLLLTRPSNSR